MNKPAFVFLPSCLQSNPEGKAGDKQLLYWVVEDAIKRRYSMFVAALEECSKDNLDFLKEKATKVRLGSW